MRGGKYYYVYIVASINRIIYIGFADSLLKRIKQHKDGTLENTFSKKYKTNKLVYWENFYTCNDAFQRERQIKKWRREKKIKLIEENNKNWTDLYNDVVELSKVTRIL